MKNKFAGSSFDSFLKEENLETEVAAIVAKRSFVHDLEAKMTSLHKKKTDFRKALGSPTTTDRVFSENVGVSLETMSRAAEVVNCDVEIRLVARASKPKPVNLNSPAKIYAKGR